MKYVAISTVNLLILLIGIVLGVMLAPHLETKVSAAEPQLQTAPNPPATAQGGGPQKVTPMVSAGTVGFFLLLSHHIQSDELVVNGLDLLKLHQAELNLLSRFVPASELQNAINGARVAQSDLYQVATPSSAPASQPPK
jgi:hypothetical protein